MEKTVALEAKPLNIALSARKGFTTGDEGFVFDPQIYLIYQHLQFHKIHDIDSSDTEMRKFNQFLMRASSHQKMIASSLFMFNLINVIVKLLF
ncbi:hypothetical protein V4B17_02235 [Bartonella sp. B23]